MVAWLVHERRLVNQYSKYNDGMYSEIISIASSGLAITIHFIGFLFSSLGVARLPSLATPSSPSSPLTCKEECYIKGRL